MDPFRMNEKKTLVKFRLSDETREQLQECLDIQRAIDALKGYDKLAESRDRTEMLEQAISHYQRHMKLRFEALPSCWRTWKSQSR